MNVERGDFHNYGAWRHWEAAVQVDQQHVGYVIGKEGKTLRSLEEEFGVRRVS